ncbi:hypothetical protein FJQ87_18370 (plasmid) [Shewanella sp. SNU WT4]|uniref:hypothetical protein n=1 Tax=Shewanella sp. SNU WT4 TaxID=2590015 RepID=UPI00112C15D2|nr:hypothetical protein [Shewanella sp. SNU WT4]QDF68678.1 hypothetical protein FJQ87_18370 [Shewanella sp. SNU WT4]
MDNTRTKIVIDESDEDISLLKVLAATSNKAEPLTDRQLKEVEAQSATLGFTRREKRKRSPYVIQKNIKIRVGMDELLSELGVAVGSRSDQETFDIAIAKLIESLGSVRLSNMLDEISK